MNLFTCSTTLHEAAGNSSKFPESLRQKIFQSVEQITTDDMNELLSKHESDADNFDGRIEANLRTILPNASISSNQIISNKTRFNSDIVIHIGDASVCLEIEKGYLSRFEFDILKMQTFASTLHQKYPNRRVFGAFIVPADNVVASHISGNSNESSYRYLTRLSRLVAQITPPLIEDILIVGYSTSDLKTSVEPTKKRKSASVRHAAHRDITTINSSLVNSDDGVTDEIKIGQLAKSTFNRLFAGKTLTQEMIENLQDITYSKKIFNIPFPILKRIDPNKPADEQRLDNKGRARYWSQEFDNGRYLVCSQWYERHRGNLMQWASQFE